MPRTGMGENNLFITTNGTLGIPPIPGDVVGALLGITPNRSHGGSTQPHGASMVVPMVIGEPEKSKSKFIQEIQRYTKIYKISSGGGAAPPGPAPVPVLSISWYIFIYLGSIWRYP